MSKKEINDNISSLNKHLKKGKELISPLKAISKISEVSWTNDRLPNYLWLAILRNEAGEQEFFDFSKNFFNHFSEYFIPTEEKEGPHDLFNPAHSNIVNFDEELKNQVRNFLQADYRIQDFLQPLLILNDLPDYEFWKSIIVPNQTKINYWPKIFQAIEVAYFHQSDIATDIRWFIVMSLITSGKVKFSFEAKKQVEEFANYPNVRDLSETRPLIRSTEGVLNAASELKTDWPKLFWEKAFKSTLCCIQIFDLGDRNERYSLKSVMQVKEILINYYYEINSDTSIDCRKECALGMAYYIIQLIEELYRPGLYLAITGRLILRSILETYLNLAYLSKKDDEELWKKYRNYGTGIVKLAYLKWLEKFPDEKMPMDEEFVDHVVNEDRWMELSNINLGHWESINLRKIADEADEKDLYDYYYDLLSSYAHGNWGAIRISSYDLCMNPLHRYHRVPKRKLPVMDSVATDSMIVFAKLLGRLIDLFPELDEKFDVLAALKENPT